MINEQPAAREALVPEPNLFEVAAWLLANLESGIAIRKREKDPAPEVLRAQLPPWEQDAKLVKAVLGALKSGFVQQLSGEARIWFKYLNRYAALYGQFGNVGFDDPDVMALYHQAQERRDDLLNQLRAARQAGLQRRERG